LEKDTVRRAIVAAVAALPDEAGVPGAAVSLRVDGRPLLTTGVGHRNLGRTVPLDAAARFYIYSVSKPLLAATVLRLAEQDRLALDDPIETILPEILLDVPVSLRHLLNHTGGLPDYGALQEYHEELRAAPDRPWTTEQFLARTLRQGLRFAPGQGWAYSNIGYLLARRAIEEVTGRALGEAMAALVFRPLGLRRPVVAESLTDARGLTPGFSAVLDRDGELHDVARRYHPGWVSHGVVIATAAELARTVEGVLVGRLLRPATRAAMLEAVAVPGEHPLFARPGYGLGLMIDLASPYGRVAGHTGEGPGYSTAAFHFPDVAGRRLTVAALANRDRGDVGIELVFAVVRVFAALV
jgi:D-alanyl-D-alanine carboxypeptidase